MRWSANQCDNPKPGNPAAGPTGVVESTYTSRQDISHAILSLQASRIPGFCASEPVPVLHCAVCRSSV